MRTPSHTEVIMPPGFTAIYGWWLHPGLLDQYFAWWEMYTTDP